MIKNCEKRVLNFDFLLCLASYVSGSASMACLGLDVFEQLVSNHVFKRQKSWSGNITRSGVKGEGRDLPLFFIALSPQVAWASFMLLPC